MLAKMFVVERYEGTTQTVVSDNQLSDHRAALIYPKWAVTCTLSHKQLQSAESLLVLNQFDTMQITANKPSVKLAMVHMSFLSTVVITSHW